MIRYDGGMQSGALPLPSLACATASLTAAPLVAARRGKMMQARRISRDGRFGGGDEGVLRRAGQGDGVKHIGHSHRRAHHLTIGCVENAGAATRRSPSRGTSMLGSFNPQTSPARRKASRTHQPGSCWPGSTPNRADSGQAW